MSKKAICLLSLVLALGLVSFSYGDEVVVGGFEGSLNGWQPGSGMTLSFGATGATAGTQAMQVDGPGGWHIDGLLNAKPHRGALGMKGAMVKADVTAFAADMTTGWMQVGMVVNGQNNDNNGANNNIGWKELGSQDLPRDGQSHTLTWLLSDALTTAIAGVDDNISWFELVLISNLDGASVTKFYVDNIRVVYEAPSSNVVIGDFEGGLDNWKAAWEGSPVLANATNGVTSGSGSLSLTTTGGYYCLQWNAPTVPKTLAGQKLTFDLTMIASEWPVGLWTKVADKVALNSNGTSGWKEYTGATAVDRLTGNATSADWGRWWDAAPDALKTYTVDISDYDVTGATWFQINISVQGGNGTAHFYFDNVQLVGPPPPVTGKSTDTIIGNWEQSMDGWVAGGGADVVFNDHNGVTLGKYSLDIFIPNGDWNQDVLTLNVIGAGLLDVFKVNRELSVDVTRLVADWPADQMPGWDGIHMIINAGGDGWSLWQDMGYRAHWLRTSGDLTQAAIWDYGQYLPRINFDKLTWLELKVVSNANDPAYTGWVLFYLDNMKLTGAGLVADPQPASGATNVPTDAKLSWTPGTFAASHHVYLGTNSTKVRNADKNSDPDVIFAEVDTATFDPNGLAFKTQYFWRVDEVNAANPDSPWPGSVWSFTTADFIIVDNFESYNDINPGEPGSNRILDAWTDGYGTTTNGALVGYNSPPYAERTVVHSGAQAMPLSYNNTGAALKSETQHVWAVPQDWTWAISGLNVLKLYTHGSPQNKAGQLYLIIEDNAAVSYKVTNPDSAVFTADEWKEWTISLNDAAVAGVNLTAVKKLVIGVVDLAGQPEANGMLHIDDIRRYPPIVIPLDPDHLVVSKTAVAPVIDGQWDTVWNDVNETKCLITNMTNTDSAAPENVNDLSARFKAMYDDNNFYFFVEVLDSVIDTTFSDYQGDGLEIYFDGDYSHGTTYDGVNDNQIRITVADVTLADTNSNLAIDGTVFKVLRTAGGYNIEASFPLAVLQIHPAVDPEPARDATGAVIPGTGIAASNIIGFEVQINDNDGTGGRQTLLRWHSDDNNSYQNPSLFGQARLVGK